MPISQELNMTQVLLTGTKLLKLVMPDSFETLICLLHSKDAIHYTITDFSSIQCFNLQMPLLTILPLLKGDA